MRLIEIDIQMRILHELKHKLGISRDLPESEGNPAKLLEELEVFFGLVATSLGDGKKRGGRKLILIIDALNIIEQGDETGSGGAAPSLLSFLPQSFPAVVRVILSTRTDSLAYNVSLL